MYDADNLKKKTWNFPFEINFLQLVTEMCTVMKRAFSQVLRGKEKHFKWQIAPLKRNLSFKCILLWFNYFWLLMFKIISPAFLAAFTLLFAMKPLVPSCVSQTMHLVHQTQRLFYLFIDVSTVILVEIFVDMLVKFMFWFLLELGNLFWFASMQFSCWAERSSLPSCEG